VVATGGVDVVDIFDVVEAGVVEEAVPEVEVVVVVAELDEDEAPVVDAAPEVVVVVVDAAPEVVVVDVVAH